MAHPLHRCPACRLPLVVLELDALEIDYCPQCGGVWLDAGEVELIAERSGVDPARVLPPAASPERPTDRRCPRCAARLRRFEAAGGGGPIELDACPRGDGFWFDAGELRRLVCAAQGAGAAVAERFDRMLGYSLNRNPQSGDRRP